MIKKNSGIRETKHLSTDADSSINTTEGWTKNTKKKKKILLKKSSKTLNAKHMFCTAKSAKKQNKNCAAILDHFQKNMFKSVTTYFHYFPHKFQISKNFGHPTLGSGDKKTFKGYLKSEQTDKHTDRHTDISTYRKHRPRGPML